MTAAKHPDKWRDTCDPFSLPYHTFRPTEILGYPHAGNDVFHMRGLAAGREISAYVKAARRRDAAIEHEAHVLAQLHGPVFPQVIDADFRHPPFSVTEEMPGMRLSAILGTNDDFASLSCMEEYGAALGQLHCMAPDIPPQADRRYRHAPTAEILQELELPFLTDYFAAPPAGEKTVFCHGDFHYANVLWDSHHISAILDFELSGYGNRDFDIAWALFRRPGQTFLKTPEEQALFLKGYARHGAYNPAAVRYYMAQCYAWFLHFCGEDAEYCAYVRAWLNENCR